MSAYGRLPVKVLVSLCRHSTRLSRASYIAPFNGWQEKRGAPVEFDIYKYEKGDPVPREHYDMFVKIDEHCSLCLNSKSYGDDIADADFTVEVDSTLEDYSMDAIEPFVDESVHWGLDRWFVNKNTEISSRLAALPEYEILALRIETDNILKSTSCQIKEELPSEIVKSLEEWNEIAAEFKEKDEVIRRLQKQTQPSNAELSDNYEVALHAIAALNHQLVDLETRLQNDNKESTGELLQTVDHLWQGQNDEILSSIENMGDHVIESFKPVGRPTGTQGSSSPPETKDVSPLEENPELKNMCSLLSKGLGDSWRELGRALEVSSRCLDDVESRYGRFGNAELAWGVLEKWAERRNPTKEDLLLAVKRIGQESILGPPMTDHHRDILLTLQPYLHKEMMDVELLVPYLRGDTILTSSQIEMIIQGHGRFEKIDKFLNMLPDMGCRAFGAFVCALERSGQTHIAEKLKEAESKDPSDVNSVEIWAETLPKDLPEETSVNEIGEEDDSSCDVQPLGGEGIDQQISNVLRFVQHIDARIGRLEKYASERMTFD